MGNFLSLDTPTNLPLYFFLAFIIFRLVAISRKNVCFEQFPGELRDLVR